MNDEQFKQEKAAELKPVDAAGNERLKKADEPAKPGEGEEKRQEPAVPHAPQDKPAQVASDQRKSEEEHLNEKRQLMSDGVDEKPFNAGDKGVKENSPNEAAARNAAAAAIDTKRVKVSEQEIDEELKKLEQPEKVNEAVRT